MGGGGFKDLFSGHAAAYAEHRPTYPPELAAILAERAGGQGLAVDCGCGSGQLSVLLADRFKRVVATDASAEQIAHAFPHPRVEYRVAPAERSGLEDHSADLVVAAQAAHWFDLPAFWDEADRIARPGGLVALVSYGMPSVSAEMDAMIRAFHDDTLGPHWSPERWLVVEGYRSIAFPFRELEPPPVAMAIDWTFAALIHYLNTWSAIKPATKALGTSPLPDFAERIAPLWGDPGAARTVRWPLTLRLGVAGSRSPNGG